MERLNKFLYGLGTGVIIGTASGLLLAPKTGKETRQIFADRKTLRPRPWRLALRARAPSPTQPGRTPSPLRRWFGCWPPPWASG